jgi:hypothetical protein
MTSTITAAELLEEYGQHWAMQLIPLCHPNRAHKHRQREPNGNHSYRPCASLGKVPVLGGWQREPDRRRESETSPDEVAENMAAHLRGGGNIGLATPRGCVFLDGDTREAASRLTSACPDAPFQHTHKGGHVPLRLPDGLNIVNTCRVTLMEGLEVDLRGHGAQIVCWPSVHSAGTPYTWQSGLPPSPEDLPLVPAAWHEALLQHSSERPRRSAEEWRRLAANGVHEGERHSSLLSLAGKVFGSNLDPIAGYELLHAWNESRCEPPLPREEAESIICDIAAKERDRRRGGRA